MRKKTRYVLIAALVAMIVSVSFQVTTYQTDNQAQAGRILDWIRSHLRPHPVPPDPTPVPPDPTPIPDPVPVPVPPTPVSGLQVLIVGPEPRVVRNLTPDQVAILSSRILRDWTDASCGKLPDGSPAFRIVAKAMPAGLLPANFVELLGKAPDGKCSLVAKSGDRFLVVDLPANTQATMTALADFSKVPPPSRMKLSVTPNPRVPTEAQWKEWNSPTKTVFVNGEKRMLSAKPRDKRKHPYGSIAGTVTLKAAGVDLIPRSEWPSRIVALKAAKAGLMNLTYGKVPCSDQSSTNFCWANSVTQSFGILSYAQGRLPMYYSAASVACPITGFSNEGGWPADALKFVQATGCVKDSLWPNAAISRSYANKPEVVADYPKHKITETIADLGSTGKMFDECVTCVLLGAPCAVSFDFWSHAVSMVGIDMKGPANNVSYVGIFRNSWGSDWNGGDQGFFEMPEGSGNNRGTPDDSQAILYTLAE